MCGIAGLVGGGNIAILNAMTDSISHRGPDDSGAMWFQKHNAGLGHRRLSIIDLSSDGHQPMCDESKRYWISFNGEIYNYKHIRLILENHGIRFVSNSDTEVLLKAYIYWGKDCLNRLNGMFAFAIFDAESGDLFAARDHIGIKPFYYIQQNGIFSFASEIKSILRSELFTISPDYYALHTPTRYQISPLTGFKDIYKLPPAHYLYYKNQELSIHSYWQILPSENPMTESVAIEQLDELLCGTIDLQMVADVEVGAFLSGGLDSSLIAALMAQKTNKSIKTFTIKFTETDQKLERTSDDSYYAQKVAASLGLEHQAFEIQPDIIELFPKLVWHMDEPLADAASIILYMMSKSARENGITVLLNGMGGDEIFGGYRKQLACLKADYFYDYLPNSIQRTLVKTADILPVTVSGKGLKWLRWGKRFLSFATLPQLERFLSADMSFDPVMYNAIIQSNTSYYDTHFYNTQADHFHRKRTSYLTEMCFNDTTVFLPEHNLTYCDKATMAASIETRPPLTDYRIVEYMFTLPPNLRIMGNEQKYLLKKVAEKYLPNEIIYREKGSFGVPLRSWIGGELKEMVDDYLSYESVKKRNLYNPDAVQKLIKLDREGRVDNAYLIWQLLTTEMWFRTFF